MIRFWLCFLIDFDVSHEINFEGRSFDEYMDLFFPWYIYRQRTWRSQCALSVAAKHGDE
jgi:hypothetical protein